MLTRRTASKRSGLCTGMNKFRITGWIHYNVVTPTGGSDKKFHRVDHYWSSILALKTESGDIKYPSLTKLLKTALSLPHGNADVERSLLVNKNLLKDNRPALHPDTMKGLRYAEDAVCFHDPVQRRPEKVPITKQMMKAVKSVRASYTVYLEDEKKKQADEKKQKELDEETRKSRDAARKKLEECELRQTNIREELAENSESLRVSQPLVDSARTRLEMGLKEENIVAVKAAKEILKVGSKQLTQSDEFRKKFVEVENRKRKATKSLETLFSSSSTGVIKPLCSCGY